MRRGMFLGIGLLLGFLLFSSLSLAEENDILFYVSFNGSPHADIAKGNKTAAFKDITYTEDKFGEAVVISQRPAVAEGLANGYVNFETKDNLNLLEGTIEMWVKPIDWAGNEETEMMFFDCTTYQQEVEGQLRILKKGSTVQFFIGKLGGRGTTTVTDIKNWKQGEWHHVVTTWKKEGEVEIYIDGEIKAKGQIPGELFPTGLGARFSIGCHYAPIPAEKHTAIDEVYIYKRDLTSSEVKNAYNKRLALVQSIEESSSVHPQPTLTLEFENGFDAKNRGDKLIKAKLEGKPELVEGRFGKALKSGPSIGYLAFPTEGIIYPDRGTIEMWISPVDWDGTDEKSHAFFETVDNGVIRFYKDEGATLTFRIDQGVNVPWENASFSLKGVQKREWWDLPTAKELIPPDIWGPGRWHHVACVWSPTRQYLYVDGECVVRHEPRTPSALGNIFHLGDFLGVRTSSSLIDRVYIYDRPLTEKQIKAHFAGDYQKKVLFSKKNFRLDYKINKDKNLLHAFVEVWGIEDEGLSATFSLIKSSSFIPIEKREGIVKSQPIPFIEAKAVMDLSLSDIPVGNYKMVATVTDKNQKSVQRECWVDVFSNEWKGNQIGLEDKVLPPWTPLEYGADYIRCWGREYAFKNNSPLPSQIISAGEKMLTRPMNLAVTVGGKLLQWEEKKGEFTLLTPTKTKIDAAAQAKVSEGIVTLHTHTLAEFDGLLVIDINLEFPEGVKPETISLEIPMSPEAALYRSRFVDCTYLKGCGDLPKGKGIVDSDKFIPYAWLGDNDRGLFWFCESREQWPNSSSENAFEVVRDGNEVLMRFNLLAEGQSLPKNWSYQFGIQATPVKPLPSDWRKWRKPPTCMVGPGVAPRCNYDLQYPNFPTLDSFKNFASAGAVDPRGFSEMIAEVHQKGLKALPYINLNNMSSASGSYHWFGDDWEQSRGELGEVDNDIAYNMSLTTMCPAAKGYADFRVWEDKQFVEQFNLDGFYHDNVFCIACGKSNHNHPPGEFWPMLATREMYKRHYAMMKSLGRETLIIMHTAPKIIPVLAYADAVLEGERYSYVLKDHYPDVLPLDTFRTGFMGRQWGYIPMFLPMFGAPTATGKIIEQIEPSRCLMAMLMIHDVIPWIQWCNSTPIIEAFEALDKFGYIDSEFIPYFDKTPPAITEMKDVYISMYKKSGKALAIIANLSREDRSGTVKINEKRIGISPKELVSWPDKTPVEYKDNNLFLSIPKQGYRMVLISGEK